MWNNKMRQIFVSIHQLSFNVEQSFTVRDYTAVYLDIYGMKKTMHPYLLVWVLDIMPFTEFGNINMYK